MDKRSEKLLEAENDPRVLRGLVKAFSEHIAKQEVLIKQLQAEHAKKAELHLNFEENIRMMRKKIFGASKENRAEATDRPRDKSQQDALLFSQSAFPSPQTREKNQSNKMRWQDLTEMLIEHGMTTDQLLEESKLREIEHASGDQWEDTGLFDESVKINIVETKYVKELHRRKKYKLKNKFNQSDKDVIVTAGGAPALLPGMNYAVGFIAHVASEKYISHLPLERQTRRMESLGLMGMSTATLSRICTLAAASLDPLAEMILAQDLLTSNLALHLDETPWKIQNKDQADGFMWVISNRYGSYYFYRPTRSGSVIKEKLEGYTGPVLTDGYAGYNILEELEIAQGYCWSHARREFIKLEGHDPSVKPILDYIDDLFSIEREAKSFDDLKKLRCEKSSSVTLKLKPLLIAEYPRSREESQKRKAIEYVMKRWAGFTLFLTDSRVPLSNNEAERTIRHAVVGRKSYYGSNTHGGATTAATIFTIVESAKKNDLDPRTFILMSLERVARGEPLETPLAYARRTRSN